MTAALLCAAVAAGYLLGRHDAAVRAFDAVQDWADGRTHRIQRWAVQPVYALLIIAAFVVNPVRFVRNVRDNRAYLRGRGQR